MHGAHFPRLTRVADANAVSHATAQCFAELARDAIAARGRFAVALSGGSTPRKLFQRLSSAPLCDAIDWPQIHFFWGDERAVSPKHSDSNYRMANEELLSKLPTLEKQHVHRMQAERSDLDSAASDYEFELTQVLGSQSPGSPAPLDLVLLGLGPDAHTASLFPDTEALKPTHRSVVANFVPKLDAWRMTLTAQFINTAHNVVFAIAGEDKAEALNAVLSDPAAGLPAQLIAPASGSLRWLVDEAAAARLGPPQQAGSNRLETEASDSRG